MQVSSAGMKHPELRSVVGLEHEARGQNLQASRFCRARIAGVPQAQVREFASVAVNRFSGRVGDGKHEKEG